jgi:RimJ/RimL family protein N-acetyltransferase
MTIPWWPLHDLRVTTPRLELRIGSYDDLVQLASLAAAGIHDPEQMPFGVPWTDAPPEERARGTMQWHWGRWAALSPDAWHLPFVVVVDGAVVGTQEVHAEKFAVRREIGTGSWLGRRFQGQGIGTHMRAAALHFAFAELGARWATTNAFDDNAASNAVTRRLGYEPDGVEVVERRGHPTRLLRYRLAREQWEKQERIAVEVSGVEACRPLLGADWTGE